MPSVIMNGSEGRASNLAIRGYNVVYREHQVNHCPGCGRTHWYVGRLMAECGFCATALPLAEASSRGGSLTRAYRPIVEAA